MTTKKIAPTTPQEPSSLQEALIAFRAKGVVAKRDGKSHHGKYATLPTILEDIKDALYDLDLCLYHQLIKDNDVYTVKTVLSFKGEKLESVFPVFGSNPQQVGSSMTYARRYNINALLDIPTEDDDGNKASEKTSKMVRVERTPEIPMSDIEIVLNMADLEKEKREEILEYAEANPTARKAVIEKFKKTLTKQDNE